MPSVPDNDNDTDLLYDDISEEGMKLSSTKTFVGRNMDLLKATNRDGQRITTVIDTTTTTAPTDNNNNNNNNTVKYDFMTMSTRSSTSLNKSTDIENDTFDQEHPSLSSTTTTPTPLLNSIELVPILQEQIRQLQQENHILKRNIGILYRTAKTEIQRKDQQLIEQQQLIQR